MTLRNQAMPALHPTLLVILLYISLTHALSLSRCSSTNLGGEKQAASSCQMGFVETPVQRMGMLLLSCQETIATVPTMSQQTLLICRIVKLDVQVIKTRKIVLEMVILGT